MATQDKIYLYRMTHVENIPHVLEFGITHATSVNANPDFTPIGDPSLIQTRNSFFLNNGRRLGEYIPFYFGVRMPMLYVIQKGFNMMAATPSESIVYCISTVQKIMEHKLAFVFTDGHAVDKFTRQYDTGDIEAIHTLLDWTAIKSRYWKSDTDLDLKRRKEAEFLVDGDVPGAAVLGFIVATPTTKKKLSGLGVSDDRVIVKPDYYF
ncbi:MAG: DUF4433 domain-containing protein [Bacteroidia bacterium]